MERMTFTAECEKGVFVLSISGELDIYPLPKLKQAAEMIIERGVRSIIFNLASLAHLDLTAIGFLIHLARCLKANRGTLCLSCLSSEVFEIFRFTRSDRLFKFENTVAEAMASIITPGTEKMPVPAC